MGDSISQRTPDHEPDVSVILCTHNPRPEVLGMVLESLQKQTLAPSQWEVIVVDNNSSPPLELAALDRGRTLPVCLVREDQPGLAAARRCGARMARADLMVMVDDDNLLDPDYLANALAIARSQPNIGAFGGMARAMLENSRVERWKKSLIPCLGVRDNGQLPITSSSDTWGPWEPIGAGMVVRRDVLEKFIKVFETAPSAARLGRAGRALRSGEDSLIARCAYRLGYQCSYQPALQLRHFIKSERLRTCYLLRLMYGHGRSNVILNRVLYVPTLRVGYAELAARLAYRLFREGFAGAIWWAWDVGYFMESRARADPPPSNPRPLNQTPAIS